MALDLEGVPMDELPRDLAHPRRDPEDVRLWAGVVVGGALMLVATALLVWGITL
jgi:hypothetical protein